jgi:glycine cleavage system H lipoate-binding protein
MLLREDPCIGCPQKCSIYQEVASPQINQRVAIESTIHSPLCVSRSLSVEIEKVRGFSFHPTVYYLPNHIWVKTESNNMVKIGFDDFALKLLSEITAIFPQSKGEVLHNIIIEQKGRVRKIPVQGSGRISGFNNRLLGKPDSMKKDPYFNSWLYELKTTDFSENLINSRKGDQARAWLEKEVDSLQEMLQAECGITLADGGDIVADFKDKISEKIIKRFLHIK